MIDTEALCKKVIDLAIQGKLTQQLPEDGNAEDLYTQIQEERAKLIKEGKIKQEKPLPEISDDEIPFEIPKNWKWVRWGKIVNVVSARRVHQSDWKEEGIPFYRAREIATLADTGIVNNELYISEELYEEFSKSGVPHAGDLMVTGVGTLGKTYVVQESEKFYYKDASVLCFENYAGMIATFLKRVMETSLMRSQIDSNSGGTTVDTLTMVRMNQYLMPLPPLDEQKRIVKIIDEIYAQIDLISDFQQQYEADREILKSKIIDAGIRGKLTEQLPEDGNAEELYAQIQKEKAKLIKEGKIKKEKPLPEISDDEISFEIPDNWKWFRLHDVCKKIVDGDHNPPSGVKERTKYLMLSAQNINNDSIVNIESARFLSKAVFDEENKRTNLEIGDVLLTIVATLGRSCVYRGGYDACFQRSVCVISTLIIPEYLKRVLDSSYIQKFMIDNATGAAQPGFYLNKVERLCIPIPPIEEQKRIVSIIESILNQITA